MITADAVDVGMSAVRLRRVDKLTHSYVDSGRLPGVITVITRRGEVVHHDIYGKADIDEDRRLTRSAIFRIYSMTKPITSLALMMLYEEGRVLLETPVSRYIPSFADVQVWDTGDASGHTTRPPEREMTVHDVLTHMSGLTAGFQMHHPVTELYRTAGLGGLVRPETDLPTAMDRLAEIPLEFSPGTRWSYGVSTDVCGRIIEVVSGEPLDQFFRDRIFHPLGMNDTDFWVAGSKIERLTTNYARNSRKELVAIDLPATSTYATRPAYLSGAGGLVSTAADYQRFCTMLLQRGRFEGQQLVSPRTLAYMTHNHLPGGRTLNEMGQSTFAEAAMVGTGFGLGFSVIVDPAAAKSVSNAGEYGWGGAASTTFWIDPAEELTVLFLTQLVPSNTFPIRRQLRAVVQQSLID